MSTNCQPLRSRLYVGGPQFFYAHVTGQAIGGADADFHVTLPFPCRIFQIVSIFAAQNSVFFHLNQLNKQYAGNNAIAATGKEEWIPMTNQIVASAAPFYWSVIRLHDAIKDFYLDMGHENGGANVITILCAAEPDALEVLGGPWT